MERHKCKLQPVNRPYSVYVQISGSRKAAEMSAESCIGATVDVVSRTVRQSTNVMNVYVNDLGRLPLSSLIRCRVLLLRRGL